MANSPVDKLPRLNFWLIIGSLAISAAFVLCMCWLFEPRWETNDDVSMSMIAHGYGVAAIGMPNLIFSNVLWGYLVRAIPEVNGILGYSIATLGVLITLGAVLFFGLYRLGAGYVASLSMLILILGRPVLFPQFTMNAGLLLVGAVVCWHLFARWNNWGALLLGCLLAFSSYLVRSQEFLLVFAVALPLLPWRAQLWRRSSQVAFLSLISAMVVSTAIDHQAYQGAEWKAFNELNPVRAYFTDFGVGEYLKQRPDILARYGYSTNDVDLIGGWFFVDPKIANPTNLRAMLSELGSLPSQENSLANAWFGVKTLWHPNLVILLLAALLLAVLRPSWQVAASWLIMIVAVFALGLLGRPGVLRVYVPLISLLVVAPFFATGEASVWRNRLGVCALLVAAIFNASHIFSESTAAEINAEQVRLELAAFPVDPVVIWGAAFPFEAIYPVLGESPSVMPYQFYGLGVSTLAPFSVAFAEQVNGRSMMDLLVRVKGIPIIATEEQFRYLNAYCVEHLHGQLKELSRKRYGAIVVSQRRCEVAP